MIKILLLFYLNLCLNSEQSEQKKAYLLCCVQRINNNNNDNINNNNHYNIGKPDKWYEHKPLPVADTTKVTIIWGFLH